MTNLYCTEDDLTEYILAAYLTKIEEINPGTISRTLENVSGEITEAIAQGGYSIPDTGSSAVLKRICAVMTAYRVVGDITSLMNTEASTGNEWLPLQRLHTKAEKDLDSIRAGKLDPFPDQIDDSGISVSAPPAMFSADVWENF
jgi:hypothetical protein